MTAVMPSRDHLRTLTPSEARSEITELIARSHMSRDELERRGNEWDLDADERGILSDIRSLEFLIERLAE